MGKKAPKAPDYTAAAEKQGESSRNVTEQQTWANRPDQFTPFGSQTWDSTPTVDPTTGQTLNRWTQTTNLTPDAQAALNAQLGVQRGVSEQAGSMLDRIKGEFGQSMDWSKIAPQGQQVGAEQVQRGLSSEGLTNLDSSQRYYDKAGDSLYNKFASRADPQFERDQASLDTTLRNRGVKPGDEAYDEELRKLRESQGDQRSQAMFNATALSGQEGSRMFGMDAAARGQMFGERQQQGQFGNTAAGQQQQLNTQASGFQTQQRQQQMAEEMQKRGFSLNEVNALLYGQQVQNPAMPAFNTASSAAPVNYSGAAQQQGQAALDAYNAKNQMIGNLAGAVTSPFSFEPIKLSDRRLKRNIRKLGTYKDQSIYAFEYLWGEPSVGVMADEVPPEFVVRHPSGYAMVNYAALFGA